MKEAAGEANMTVITIILIGVIAAIAIPLINGMMKSTKNSSCCQTAGGELVGASCNAVAGGPAQATVTANFDACIAN